MTEPRPVTFSSGSLTLVGDAYGDPSRQSVVLLHGGGQTRHAWGATAAALAARGFHATALDLRGHGDSDWASDGDYSIEAMVADLRAVVAAQSSAPAVVGASLGGLTALCAQGESTGPLARAIVLVDITPRVQPEGVERILSFMTANPNGFADIEEASDAVAAYIPHRPRPKDLNGLRKNLRLRPDGRWRWHWDPAMMTGDRRMNATRNPDRLDAAARALNVPTLLVRGRMSDLVSEEDARHFLSLAPHARYADVSGAGHMVAGDQNDPFTDAVVDFLKDVAR